MGGLFYLDAAPGTHSFVAILTMAFGIIWFVIHHNYERWHHGHGDDHIHH